MFTSLMTYEDLKTHPKERQTEILTKWRETYSESEIIESLGVEEEVYHQLLADLGLEKKEMKKKRTFPNSRPDADPKQVIPFNDLKKLPKKINGFLYPNIQKSGMLNRLQKFGETRFCRS